MSDFGDFVIPAQAGIQTKLGSLSIVGLDPSLRWGDNMEVSA
ncbi:hypothetical protein [Sphingopyxis sp. BSNA05]|nr:hypothetical protein [Sphingopyxis sp. BSNA05]